MQAFSKALIEALEVRTPAVPYRTVPASSYDPAALREGADRVL